MWPHAVSIGVGGKAISIGTDTPEAIADLGPWQILDVGGPTDYCLELRPAAVNRGTPRPLPGLYHGSMTLLRSRDTTKLTEVFLRVLGSHARLAGPGQVRLNLMPVVRDGVALLVPPANIGAVPDRWMTAQGIEAVYTVSSVVDAEKARVLVDPPLGSNNEPAQLVLGGWWLPYSESDSTRSPGFAVAEVMKLATDVTAANAASVLRAVAKLVERAHPEVAPRTAAAFKDRLADAISGAVSS